MPAFAAAAASLGRELTVPGVAQTVILTRTAERATAMPPGEDLATLGASRATMVLHLAVQRIEAVVAELIPNYGADCPVAVVARASRADEVILRGTLADIAGPGDRGRHQAHRGDRGRRGPDRRAVPGQPPLLARDRCRDVRVLILGGTTEGRALARRVAGRLR